jgi:hypothetical protein
MAVFVPDVAKGEAFYRDRLRVVTTDRFVGVGPFMRPKAWMIITAFS